MAIDKKDLRKLPVPALSYDFGLQEVFETLSDKLFPASADIFKIGDTDVFQICLYSKGQAFYRTFCWYENDVPHCISINFSIPGSGLEKRKAAYRWVHTGIGVNFTFYDIGFDQEPNSTWSKFYAYADTGSKIVAAHFLAPAAWKYYERGWNIPNGWNGPIRAYKHLNSFEAAEQEHRQKTNSARKAESINQKSLDEMGEIPALPDDFDEFITHKVNAKQHRLFYDPTGKTTVDVFCTHCNQRGKVRRDEAHPKLFRMGECPVCGRKSYFMTDSRYTPWSKKIKEHPLAAAVCQPVTRKDGRRGFVIRYFTSWVTPKKNTDGIGRTLECKKSEVLRQVVFMPLHPGEEIMLNEYDYFFYGHTGISIWKPNTYWGETPKFSLSWGGFYDLDHDGTILYTKNLETALAKTDYKGAADIWKKKAENAGDNGIRMYSEVYRYAESRIYEFFRAMHMDHMAAVLEKNVYDRVNWFATRPEKVLNTSRENFLDAKRLNLDMSELELLEKAKEDGIKIRNKGDLAAADLLRDRNETIVKAVQAVGYRELANYFNKGHDKKAWRNLVGTVSAFNYPFDIYYLTPKNIDEMVNQLKTAQLRNMQYRFAGKYAKINSELGRLKQFCFSALGSNGAVYQVTFPGSIDDLAHEGAVLHHCVGSPVYADGISKHEKLVFFVRKQSNTETPFTTMSWDIKARRIEQCKGMGDRDVSEKNPVNKVLREFSAYLERTCGDRNPWDVFLEMYQTDANAAEDTASDAISEFCYRTGLSRDKKHFRSLGDDDFARIAKFLDSNNLPGICGCVKVSENEEYITSDKYRLLWHGSATENWPKIVREGLKIMDVAANGRTLGDGIYFSPNFAKSVSYCSHKSTGVLGIYAIPDNSVVIRSSAESAQVAASGADSADLVSSGQVILFHPEAAKLCYLVEYNQML